MPSARTNQQALVSPLNLKTVRLGRDPSSGLLSPTSLSPLSPFFPSSVPGCLAPDTSCDDDSNSIAGCSATTRSEDSRITGVDSVYSNPTSSPHIGNALAGSEEMATDQSALRSNFGSAHLVEEPFEPQGRASSTYLAPIPKAQRRTSHPPSPKQTSRSESSALDGARSKKKSRVSSGHVVKTRRLHFACNISCAIQSDLTKREDNRHGDHLRRVAN